MLLLLALSVLEMMVSRPLQVIQPAFSAMVLTHDCFTAVLVMSSWKILWAAKGRRCVVNSLHIHDNEGWSTAAIARYVRVELVRREGPRVVFLHPVVEL